MTLLLTYRQLSPDHMSFAGKTRLCHIPITILLYDQHTSTEVVRVPGVIAPSIRLEPRPSRRCRASFSHKLAWRSSCVLELRTPFLPVPSPVGLAQGQMCMYCLPSAPNPVQIAPATKPCIATMSASSLPQRKVANESNGTAATRLKKKFNRQGSGNVYTMSGSQTQQDGGENGSVEPNENTGLLHRMTTNEHGTPYKESGNPLVKYPFLTVDITWKILKTNYVNIFLVFVPLGIVAGIAGWNPTAVFVLNFLAIIPLASLLAFATEELAVPLGQTIGGLLNATFGNAVELIVSIFQGHS